MSRTYELSAVNETGKSGTFCLFQADVSMGGRGLSLAWMTKMVPAKATAAFRWETAYQFVAGKMELRPGAVFKTSSKVDADPVSQNLATLGNGASPSFQGVSSGGRRGSLTISTDASISGNGLATGIGMNGSPLYVDVARPMMSYVHSTEPHYRLAFGTFNPGEALDPSLSSTDVTFPANRFALTVTLNADGSWTV
ncbi:MAG TPA: hypothetical protein VF787_21585 [Thermoanaerobaculia bacterium]